MKKFDYRVFVLFIFIVLCWGLAWPINKIGLAYMPPSWYTASRLLIGTFCMLAIVIAFKKFSWPQWRDLPLILAVGLLEIGLYLLLANVGLSYMPAGRSALIAYTTPLWVMPIATLLFKEESTWLKWVGFLFGLGGLIVLLNPWQMDWQNESILIGTGALLLASLCWAISMLCVRYMKWTKTPLELIPWQLLVGAIPIVIYAMMHEPLDTIQWSNELLLSLVYTGILVTGLSYWCGVIINKKMPTIVLSLSFLIVPVFSLTVSAIFLSEVITLPMGMGMLLILAGLICMIV